MRGVRRPFGWLELDMAWPTCDVLERRRVKGGREEMGSEPTSFGMGETPESEKASL
jgi:hypothetical protein